MGRKRFHLKTSSETGPAPKFKYCEPKGQKSNLATES